MTMKIGILALQGDVSEHFEATKKAANNLNIKIEIVLVRKKEDLIDLAGIIIPGGESTVLQKLTQREGIFEDLKKIKNIFGTCAGAIMLAKNVNNKEKEQETLELMNITIDRNAYGVQIDSFEETITSTLGTISAVFIRAPRITKFDKKLTILASIKNEPILIEEKLKSGFYLACCFHPELTTTIVHEYFLKNTIK